MTCHIIGAGEFLPFSVEKKPGDIVIACDGGLIYAEKLGIKPDLIIGDFDSLGYIPEGNVLVLPEEKDYTDVGAAVEYALKHNFDDFKFYCCLGNRLSHSLANVQLAIKLSRMKKSVKFYGRENLTAITDGTYAAEKTSGTLSVFSAGQAQGVTLSGFKYPLDSYDMTDEFPIGVSNEIIKERATVTVKSGTLIIIY